MFKIYEAESNIAEIGGKLHSSLTAVAEDPRELAVIGAACADVILSRDGFPVGDAAEREALGEIANRLRDIVRWSESYDQDRGTYDQRLERALAQAEEFAGRRNAVARLMVSLAVVGEIWGDEVRIGGKLLALVSVRPHWLGKSGIYYRADAPALVLYDGSWRCSLTRFVKRSGKFVCNAGAFAVALVSARIGAASTSGEEIAATLRSRAAAVARFPLSRLDELTQTELAGKKGVIVLLHGLFSTDARTFDGFIERWRDASEFEDFLAGLVWRQKCGVGSASPVEEPGEPDAADFGRAFAQAIERDFLIVGWPHNTLTSIRENAEQLIRELKATLGRYPIPIVFVCHSRGGLLARKVAASAYPDPSCAGLWPRFAGCVTFGTPHEGAPFAEREKPMQKLAAVLMVGSATGNTLSVAEVLAYYQQEKEFPGIDDLAPSSVKRGAFLRELRREERQSTSDSVAERYLRILPVGGDFGAVPVQQQPRVKRVLSHVARFLLSGKNDLIVELISSVPRIGFDSVVAGGCTAACDHSGYFEPDQIHQAHFRAVIEKIREFLNFDAAVCSRVAVAPKPPASSMDDVLRLLKDHLKGKKHKL